jgi:preprotein translocase subunit SecA
VLGGNPEHLALDKCGGDKEHAEYPQKLARYEAQCAAEREEVLAAGGLHILGTERHESRRIDNQLRGRAGRQGDPGSSQFFLSLEDDLLRIFGGERITPWMERLGLQEGEAIEHRMITRAIENAQKKVEARNFDIRKHLLDYDNVMNRQRQAFYSKRREILALDDIHDEVLEILEGVLVGTLAGYWPDKGAPDDEALAGLAAALEAQFGVPCDPRDSPFTEDGKAADDREALGHAVHERLTAFLEEKRSTCNGLREQYPDTPLPAFSDFEREILLTVTDRQWKDHLHAMDGLREGVSLRGYAQRDPKIEYQREGFALFEEMSGRVDQEVAEILFKFALPDPEQARAQARPAPPGPGGKPGLPEAASGKGGRAAKVGRNDPCPCGSGKKYKKCCGAT